MRALALLLLVVHGLLHLIGFAKDGLGKALPGLTGETLLVLPAPLIKVVGAAWMLACLLFLGAAALFALRQPTWWMPAGAALVLSQLLIVHAWQDAKVGTLPNLVLALMVVASAAGARFGHETSAIVRALRAGARDDAPRAVTIDDLANLPPPVGRWLQVSGVVGSPRPNVVRILQRGAMRTAPDGKAMPTEAEQHFTVDPPGFVWGADVAMFGVPVQGRDSYIGGHGGMLIKLLGLWPLVNARGPEIDQGTLLRFVAELIWFPGAALESYLKWEAIDDAHARVTMSYAGTEASADLTFERDGRLRELRAQRYLSDRDGSRLEPWGARMAEWKRFQNVTVPSKGEVFWELKAGRFTYYTWELTALEYDPPRSE